MRSLEPISKHRKPTDRDYRRAELAVEEEILRREGKLTKPAAPRPPKPLPGQLDVFGNVESGAKRGRRADA